MGLGLGDLVKKFNPVAAVGGALGSAGFFGHALGRNFSNIAPALPIIGPILAGEDKKEAAEKEAALLEEEGRRAARRHKENTEDFRRSQRMEFLKSGVTIKGSPLLVLEETREKGLEDAEDMIRKSKSDAEVVRAGGRAMLTEGYTSGVSQGLQLGSLFL